MPKPIEVDELNQKAVLFPLEGRTIEAEPILGEPVEIEVRWDKTNRQMKLSDTETVLIDATVVLDRDAPLGTVLWEGELEDWYGTGSNDVNTDRVVVVRQDSDFDVKRRSKRRVVYCMKYRES